jgi:hypothetical protein
VSMATDQPFYPLTSCSRLPVVFRIRSTLYFGSSWFANRAGNVWVGSTMEVSRGRGNVCFRGKSGSNRRNFNYKIPGPVILTITEVELAMRRFPQ